MSNITINQLKWLFSETWVRNNDAWQLIKQPIKLMNEYDRWRKVAKILKIPKEARKRLEWIIYYYEGNSATLTARHFGISRKTFYKWYGKLTEIICIVCID
jgi:DNA invertase Pin-like site-specific DNA recombinase